MAIFAKYDGIDGESKDANHDRWIDIVSVDWGAHQPGGGNAGRRRSSAVLEDMVLTMDYDKASPKLQEKCLKGAIVPKLEIEFTASFGGARATYLRYELKNVMITSYEINSSDEGAPPSVSIANQCEEIKATYTEFDADGSSRGNIETEYKVRRKSKKKK